MKLHPTPVSPRWHVAGAIAAWLLPGLGHWLLGQRQRAVILFLAIGGLWLGGFFIGGATIFDRKAHPVWFLGQMLNAPSVAVEYWHRHHLQGPDAMVHRPDSPDNVYAPSYGHIHEQGVLYTALAGMLNLLAMMDVLYQDPAARTRKQAVVAPAPEESAAAVEPEAAAVAQAETDPAAETRGGAT